MTKQRNDDVKVARGVYRTSYGWRVNARIRPANAPAGTKGALKWKRIDDPDHELSLIKVKQRRDEWKTDAARDAETATERVEGTGIAADLEQVYVKLPQVTRLTVFKRGERQMQLRELVTRIGGDRPRLSITKTEWELVLGELQRENSWAAGTFNKWLTSLKDFYTELESPNGGEVNPVRKIEPQPETEPLPRDIERDLVERLLARLHPSAHVARNRISFQQEQLARRLDREGVSKSEIGRTLGVSDSAVGKLLRRQPLQAARETERIYLVARTILATGIRPIQFEMLEPTHFAPDASAVWVTQTGKRDRSFWKPLDDLGLAAMHAVADANAWGPIDRHNLGRMWRAACKAEGLSKPYPRIYDLRHTYMTDLVLASESLEDALPTSGHFSVKTLSRYAKAAVNKVAQRSVEKLGILRAEQQRAREAAAAAAANAKGGDVVVFKQAKAPLPKPLRREAQTKGAQR